MEAKTGQPPTHPFKNIDFRRRRKQKPATLTELEHRRRLIQEYLETHAITYCAPGFSRVDI